MQNNTGLQSEVITADGRDYLKEWYQGGRNE